MFLSSGDPFYILENDFELGRMLEKLDKRIKNKGGKTDDKIEVKEITELSKVIQAYVEKNYPEFEDDMKSATAHME